MSISNIFLRKKSLCLLFAGRRTLQDRESQSPRSVMSRGTGVIFRDPDWRRNFTYLQRGILSPQFCAKCPQNWRLLGF